MLPFVYQPMPDAYSVCFFLQMCVWLWRYVWQAWNKASSGKKYKKKLLPVTVFELITGTGTACDGALQMIGEFDDQADASAAAEIPGKTQKNGLAVYQTVRRQLMHPSKESSKATLSSSGGSYYFIYTFQLGCAITDVDIKAKLALRGTPPAQKELKEWKRSQAGA
jgi:hypothetical protein